jgi:hypothetical protein
VRSEFDTHVLKLLVGAFLAPIAAAVNFQANYMLVPFACQSGQTLLLHGIMGVSLLVALWGFSRAWQVWRATGATWPDEEAGQTARSRFASMFGMLFSGTACLLIVMQWIPLFLMNPCVE